jgi:bifunctional UDP-N-acetylglucosamine pyrophosphorylase/glucosamine-1-phosphate N-acetyltransferase
VEAKDASAEELAVREVNSGLYCIDTGFLRRALPRLRADNRQREYYLTDLVALAAAGGGVRALVLRDAEEVQGVNTLPELTAAEAHFSRRRATELAARGVEFEDPGRVHLDADVRLERSARIGSGVRLLGDTHVGAGAVVGRGAVLQSARIGAGARVGEGARIEGVGSRRRSMLLR